MKNLKTVLFMNNGQRLLFRVRIMSWLSAHKLEIFSHLIELCIQRKFNVYISRKAKIAKSVRFKHPTGLVIGEGVCIEQGVVIYQNVTLGGARRGDNVQSNYPSIGRNTIIFAGACIIGKVNIGENVVVGANAVVTRDIPSDCIAVGAPAIAKLRKQ